MLYELLFQTDSPHLVVVVVVIYCTGVTGRIQFIFCSFQHVNAQRFVCLIVFHCSSFYEFLLFCKFLGENCHCILF